MLSNRLIHMVESHSDQLNQRLLDSIRADERLKRFSQLPDSELLYRFEDVCGHLGEWLVLDDEEILRSRYENLGRERFAKGVPIHETVRLAQHFQQRLVRYVRSEALEQNAVELYAERELERLIEAFFHKVVYHLVRGYEEAVLESVCGPHLEDGSPASPAWLTLCALRAD